MTTEPQSAASPPTAARTATGGKGSEKGSKANSPAGSGGRNTPVGAASPPTAQNEGEVVEAEMVADEADSLAGDGESIESSTASISSSVMQYRTIMGRTYHSERGNAQYWGANDERQMESMDMNHQVLTMAIGDKLHLAPLPEKLDKVVDIGTGTGLWAIDFADEHPECEVIGTDLSPIQPGWIPPNLQFQIDDCGSEWTFSSDSLDFVYMRYLTGSIIDWYGLFASAYRCLKPGAYLESTEASPYVRSDDDTLPPDGSQAQWGPLFVAGGEMLGRTFKIVDEDIQRKGMEAAGFVDIQEYVKKVPFGGWPKDPKLKEMGRYAQATLEQDVEGYIAFVAGMQGWTKEEITVFAARMRKEFRDPKIHTYFKLKVVWGRKPE